VTLKKAMVTVGLSVGKIVKWEKGKDNSEKDELLQCSTKTNHM